jgi:hypothetical protein
MTKSAAKKVEVLTRLTGTDIITAARMADNSYEDGQIEKTGSLASDARVAQSVRRNPAEF